nr:MULTISPECIES: oligopeptide/dipeptide ABC transporter ATP-binding protein [Frankia]
MRGDVSGPPDPLKACRFHPRCWKAEEVCRTVEPPLSEVRPGHRAACHFPEERELV